MVGEDVLALAFVEKYVIFLMFNWAMDLFVIVFVFVSASITWLCTKLSDSSLLLVKVNESSQRQWS